MEGKRYPDNHFPETEGGYSKVTNDKQNGIYWLMWPPGAKGPCTIGRKNIDGSPFHWVEEHADGTITVQPNPPDAPPERRNSNSILFGGFHGYIRRGVWDV